MPLKFKKPLKRRTVKAKRRQAQNLVTAAVRAAVFLRDDFRCRVCGAKAESMHELKPRSLGGTRSLENSVACCGSGTTKCHGDLQSHRMRVAGTNANEGLLFYRSESDQFCLADEGG